MELTEQEREEREEQIEEAMREAGQVVELPAQVDYFGFEEAHRIDLPDGRSWVEIKVFTEGDRRRYQNAVQRDMKLNQRTQEARISMRPGDERYELLRRAIVNWNLVRQGKEVPCKEATIVQFLDSANPKLIDLIDKEVRKLNPWLMADVSVEDIDREIAELEELRQRKIEEEAGNPSSSSK